MTGCLFLFWPSNGRAQTKVNWQTQIGNFPAGCGAGTVATTIGPSVTCSAPVPSKTVATLPSAGASGGLAFFVTDGANVTDCTTGGGTLVVLCRSNGTSWSAAGGGVGYPAAGLVVSTGSGWSPSIAETDGYVAYGSAGSWGKSNAPALSAANMTGFPTLNQNTTGTAAGLTGCTTSTAGSICYWNGTAWNVLAGNSSGTNFLQETSVGVPSWAAPSGGVTSVSGTSPIVVSPTTGATVVSCPTCSTGASSSTGDLTDRLAGPIQVIGGSSQIGTVTYCDSPGNLVAVKTCALKAPTVVGELLEMILTASSCATSETFTINDTQNNSWALIAPEAPGTSGNMNLFQTTAIAAGADTITIATTCATDPFYAYQSAIVIPVFNSAGVDIWGGSADANCVTLNATTGRCTYSVTTTYANESVVVIANNPNNGPAQNVTLDPVGVPIHTNIGNGFYSLALDSQLQPGTYTANGTQVSAGGPAYDRLSLFSLLPSYVGHTPVFATTTTTTGLTSLALGTVASGQTILVQVQANTTLDTACAVTSPDPLGNVWKKFLNGEYYSNITAGGSDTITLASCDFTSGAGAMSLAWGETLSGSWTPQQSGSVAGSPVTLNITPTDPNSLALLANTELAENACTFSGTNYRIAGSSNGTVGAGYCAMIGVAPLVSPNIAYSFTTTISATFGTWGAYILLSPVAQPTYPLNIRPQVASDETTPTGPGSVVYSATPTFSGLSGSAFGMILTGDVSTFTLTGMTNNVRYRFAWKQDATGGRTVLCPSNVNFCPPVNTAANSVTNWTGVWNGYAGVMAFDQDNQVPTGWTSPQSPAQCGPATLCAVAMPVGATSLTVYSTAVTSSSYLSVVEDASLTIAGVTCNTSVLASPPEVTARSAGNTITITTSAAPATNPACYDIQIINPITAQKDLPPGSWAFAWLASNETYANNAAATVLHDMSGNANNATLSGSATGATFLTGQINGLPAVSWPGTTNGEYVLANVISLTNVTVYIEFIDNSAAESVQASGSGPSALILNSTAGELRMGLNNYGVDVSSAASLVNGTAYQANFNYNYSSGAWAWRIAEAASTSGTAPTSQGSNWSHVGWYFPTGFDSDLKVAGIWIRSGSDSAATTAAVEAWIKQKFAN